MQSLNKASRFAASKSSSL